MRTEEKAGGEGQNSSSEDALAGGRQDSRKFCFSSSCPLALPERFFCCCVFVLLLFCFLQLVVSHYARAGS